MFFQGCSIPHQKTTTQSGNISIEEQLWIEKFFSDFFIKPSYPLFTVFGSKPLSSVSLDRGAYAKFKDYVDKHTEALSEEEYELCRQYLINHQNDEELTDNWDRWIKWIQAYPESPFLFFESKSKIKDVNKGYIVNTQEMIWTLQHYYSIFQRELGYDFDPVQMTLDCKNSDSAFWNTVLSNDFLLGICYGFGEKNAYFFSLMINPGYAKTSFIFHQNDDFVSNDIHGTVKKLSLPDFCSYRLPFSQDPVVEKYRHEKKEIEKHLNKNNSFELLLSQLTGT